MITVSKLKEGIHVMLMLLCIACFLLCIVYCVEGLFLFITHDLLECAGEYDVSQYIIRNTIIAYAMLGMICFSIGMFLSHVLSRTNWSE